MRRIFKNTWAVLDKNEQQRFCVLAVFDVIISLLDILFLAALLWIIQFYIQPASVTHPSFLPGWLTDKNSVLPIALFLLLFAIKNIAAFFISKAHYDFNGDVALRITRNNLYSYQRSAFSEFINTDSSILIRKINLQPFEFCQHVLSGFQQIITQVCLIAIAVTAIVIFNATLFLLLLTILVPPVIAIFYFIRKRLHKTKTDIRSGNQLSYQHLQDALKGYVESNIYDRHEFFMQRYMKDRKKFGKSLFESISIQSIPPRIIEIFAVLGLFILVAIANWSGNTDASFLVTIGAFMAAAYKIIPGIVKIINVSGQIRAYEFSPDDFIEKKNETTEKQAEVIQSIQLNHIYFQYGEQIVFHNFSLQICKGNFIGITGHSGIGKTTILNLLLGFLKPAKGEILVNEKPVSSDDLKKLWPSISYVRQQTFLIHDTILRNITLEEETINPQKLNCAVHSSGLNEFIKQFPEGPDKMITENGKNISGGQQQRIALARAMYKDADLILLDEPFNELDDISVQSLLEYFRELSSKGKMIIMITHDKKSLSYCDKIISLDEQS